VSDLVVMLAVVVCWLLVQWVVLPRLGVPT
jgi:hypothetical protein